MTIAAEMARLAAIECLAPTAALVAGSGFPTLAGARVFDSRAVALTDLDRREPYTAVLSLYTRKSESARRGPGQGSVSRNGRTILEIVVELAIAARDESGEEFADALADDDPEARIVLSALCAQVRYQLTEGLGGALFRKAVIAVDGIEFEPYAVPQLGLRWQRTTMLLDCQIPDDSFRVSGGLPEPAASIAALLPTGCYAAGILSRLASQFGAAAPLPRIETIAFETKQRGVSGQAGAADQVGPPFADVEE